MKFRGGKNCQGARPIHYNHLDDSEESDQYVVNNSLSLQGRHRGVAVELALEEGLGGFRLEDQKVR